MLNAGIKLTDALNVLTLQVTNPHLRAAVTEIRDLVRFSVCWPFRIITFAISAGFFDGFDIFRCYRFQQPFHVRETLVLVREIKSEL